jgi:uncharacterized membrane protein
VRVLVLVLSQAGEPARDDGTMRSVPTRVWVLTGLVGVFYSAFALVRFWTVQVSAWDLVIFDQAVRSYSHFDAPTSMIKGVHAGYGPDFNVLADHVSPILATLAPLYWIHDGPETLLVAQALLFAAAIVPLFTFTRRALDVRAAYCVSIAYALSWPIAEALSFDFHETAFAPLLFAVLAERWQAGRRWQAALAALLLLLVKEDAGLLVAGFGLCLLTQRGARRWGIGYVLGGLAWTLIAARLVIPYFGGDPAYYWAYGQFGKDLPSAASQGLTHPWHVATTLVSPSVKIGTVALLLIPFLLTALRSPMILAVLPLLAERMLSDHENWWSSHYHYNAFLVVPLAMAAVDGVRRLRGDRLWSYGLIVVAVVLLPIFPFKKLYDPDFYRRDVHASAMIDAAAQVPSGVLVETANLVGPQLSARADVLLWDGVPHNAPWVVADVGIPINPMLDTAKQRTLVADLLAHGYALGWQRDGIQVLHRP